MQQEKKAKASVKISKSVSKKTTLKKTDLAFPKQASKLNAFEAMAMAFNEINASLQQYPQNINTFVFDQVFAQGKTTCDILAYSKEHPEFKIPCRERLRQIFDDIAKKLGNGERVRVLKDAKLRPRYVEEITELRKVPRGLIVPPTLLPAKHANKLLGISQILGMNIIAKDSVMHMLTYPFLFTKKLAKERFKYHYLSVYHLLQETVRPITIEKILEGIARSKMLENTTPDREIVELVLQDNNIFSSWETEEGEPGYVVNFDYLNLQQKFARIIFEKKAVSMRELNLIMESRGSEPRTASVYSASKLYPWCVPMGRVLWVYKVDGQPIESVQEVVKEYCHEHVRFTFEEMLTYIKSRGYVIKENSLRSYITKHCRRMKDDRNAFCLTEKVPEQEEHLWSKKVQPYTRTHVVAYHKQLIRKLVKIVKHSPEQRVLRKELRKQAVEYLEKQGVKTQIFYKLVKNTDRLKIVDIDGQAWVCFVK